MEKSTDFELVKKKDYYTLWKKYEALMMIYYKKLPEDVRNYVFEDFTDFKSSCYQVLINAVDALTLSKIKNSDTWTFWQQFSFYLQNYTTRNIVRDTYKLWNSERQQTISDERNKYIASEDIDNLPYKEFMQSLSQNEKEIVDSRLNGETWGDLYKKYGKKSTEELRHSIIDKYTKYLGD